MSFLNANVGDGVNPAGGGVGAPVANLNSVSKVSENVSTSPSPFAKFKWPEVSKGVGKQYIQWQLYFKFNHTAEFIKCIVEQLRHAVAHMTHKKQTSLHHAISCTHKLYKLFVLMLYAPHVMHHM